MRLITLKELLRLTRSQLFAMHARIVRELDETADDSAERFTALANLRLIRYVLSRQNTIATLRRHYGLAPSLGC
jgi:hypothetical protein